MIKSTAVRHLAESPEYYRVMDCELKVTVEKTRAFLFTREKEFEGEIGGRFRVYGDDPVRLIYYNDPEDAEIDGSFAEWSASFVDGELQLASGRLYHTNWSIEDFEVFGYV